MSLPPAYGAPDLSVSPSPRRVHVVAVGGAAMSAIAVILFRMGHRVSGSDQRDSAVLDQLRAMGIEIQIGHDAAHVTGADLVAVSTAVKPGNVELDAALAAGIPIAGRGDMMDAIARSRRTVAISGTAGKTTTSAMAAMALRDAGWDPSFIVGGTVLQAGTGVEWHRGEWLVAEADESDGSFLRFKAEAVIVNNVEEDHLDLWGSMAALEAGFDRFVVQATGPKVIGADDEGARALVRRVGQLPGLVTFGTSAAADYRIVEWSPTGMGSRFRVLLDGGELASVHLGQPGIYNARNATAVLAMAHQLGISVRVVAEALARFGGVGRRFEHRGATRGVTFIDDYAHLPSKVAAAVGAARSGTWRRVIAVFQPHRYTRTEALADQFADSFVGADVVVITDVFAAGQAPIPGVTGRLVADAVAGAHPDTAVVYVENRDELRRELEATLSAGDVCLTMNAGDLTTLPDEMLNGAWARRREPAVGSVTR